MCLHMCMYVYLVGILHLSSPQGCPLSDILLCTSLSLYVREFILKAKSERVSYLKRKFYVCMRDARIKTESEKDD